MADYSNYTAAGCDWPLDVAWLLRHNDSIGPVDDVLVERLRCLCVEQSTYERFRFVVDVLIVCPLSVTGLVGNCLSVVVLRRDSSINYATSLLLGAIALVDNLYLVSCLLYQTVKAVCYYGPAAASLTADDNSANSFLGISEAICSPSLLNIYPHIERVAWATAGVAMTTVTWLVVVVTLGRYCAICRPLDSLRLGTSKRVRKILAAVVLLAALYNVPSYFEHSVVVEPDWCRSRQQTHLEHTDMRRHPIYFVVYKTLVYFIFRFLLPLTTLTVLNGRLLVTLRRQRTYHVDPTQQQQQHASNRDVNDSITKVRGLALTDPSAAAAAARRRRHECLRLRRFSRADDPSVTALVVSMVSLFIICQLPDLMLRLWVTAGQLRALTGESQAVSFASDELAADMTTTTTPTASSDYPFSMLAAPASGTPESAVVDAAAAAVDGDDSFSFALAYWNTATNALLTLNSSANCFVYCFSGHRFRQHLRQLICGCGAGRGASGRRNAVSGRRLRPRGRRRAVFGRSFDAFIRPDDDNGSPTTRRGSGQGGGGGRRPVYGRFRRRALRADSIGGNSSSSGASLRTAQPTASTEIKGHELAYAT